MDSNPSIPRFWADSKAEGNCSTLVQIGLPWPVRVNIDGYCHMRAAFKTKREAQQFARQQNDLARLGHFTKRRIEALQRSSR